MVPSITSEPIDPSFTGPYTLLYIVLAHVYGLGTSLTNLLPPSQIIRLVHQVRDLQI